MFRNEKILNLSALIDIKFLQELQDTFAKSMNVASLTVDNKGPITKPSNFSNFCTKFIRGSEVGLKRCIDCDIKNGQLAAEIGEPVLYSCHAGLTDFAVPIIVNGEHLASILGGQVLTEPPNEEYFRAIAKEIGVVDEESYIEELRKINIVSVENIQAAARLLYIVANTMSEIGHKNLELFKKNKSESLHKIIMSTIRATLDSDETKKRIVNIIGQTLNADRCFIVEYDKKTDEYLTVTDEYLSSEEILPFKGVDVNKEIPNIANAVKSGKHLIINNKEIYIDKDRKHFDMEEEAIEKFGVKSAFAFPLYHSDEMLGALAIHYVKKNHVIREDEINLLKTIANQIAIALHQAKLYKITQVQAERERINRNIIEILSSTLDKSTIKNLFVKNIGEYFQADRVLFAEYDSRKKIFLPVDKDSEYLSSDKEKSFVDYEWVNPCDKEFIQPLKENKELNIFSWDEYIEHNQKSQDFISLFEEADVKSSYNIPVLYKEKLMGFFCIEFTQNVCKLLDEDLNLIRSISKQAAIGLYHSELYVSAHQAALAKGEFIANISHEIKTPLNIIMGFSEILSESQLDRDKEIAYLNNIRNSGKYLLDLTNDIIHVSKLESGNFKLKYENVDSESLIMEVVNSIKLIAEEKGININIEITKASVKADKKMLIQILYNILNNAIKFTAENGHIKIQSELDKDKLVISIADTGIGISKQNQNIIFEKFRQVDSSYSRMHQGVGLGLAITKNLIDMHDGSLHLESEEGKGSRFWFVLPNAKKTSKKLKANICY